MDPATLRALLATRAGQAKVRTMLDAGEITARQIMEARNSPADRAALVAMALRDSRG